MELRQLQYLVAVAEEANFTRAAQRIHVAQPGVSAQIRQLERELGQALFDRTPSGVRPTAAGTAVLEHARTALAAVDAARQAVDDLAGLLRGRVRIGMVTACESADLTELLRAFRTRYPGVDVTVREDTTDVMVAALRDGDLDLALVGLTGTPPAGLASRVLVDDAVVAVVAPTDPLSRRATVELTALRDRGLICLPPGTGVRNALDNACAGKGFRPRIAVEAAAMAMLVRLTADGFGVGVVPESVAAAVTGVVHTVRIIRPVSRSRLELAWRSPGPISPAAQALVALARVPPVLR